MSARQQTHCHISEDTAFHDMNVSNLRNYSWMSMDHISLICRISLS
jgi:hypothetical protein